MAITSKTVEAINEAAQQLPLQPVRVAELPVELGQFADAMARVRARLAFDQDPSALQRALRAAAARR